MEPRHAFLWLDGVRGIAALAVFLFHAHPLFGDVAPSGYLAVDLFFVLSGFVIAHAYGSRLSDGMSAVEFIKLRLVRFYPLYALGLVLGIILTIAVALNGSPADLGSTDLIALTAMAVFFVPWPLGGDIFPLNVPSWSLFYELVVNAIYGACARWLTPRAIMMVAGVSLAVLAAGIFSRGSAGMGPAFSDAPLALARTTFSFSAGLLLYQWRRPIRFNPLIALIAVALLPVTPVSPTVRPYFDLVCIAVVFPAVVLALAGGRKPLLLERPLQYLGAISFPLYAIHYPLIWLARGGAEAFDLPMKVVGGGLMAVLLVVCPVLHSRFDAPLRRRLLQQGCAKALHRV